jgi:hypothetical protein
VNVREWVGVEEKQVSELSCLNGALRLELAKKFGRTFCGGLKSLHGREPSLNEIGEIFVQAPTWENIGSGDVCAGHDADASCLHFARNVEQVADDFFAQGKVGVWFSNCV